MFLTVVQAIKDILLILIPIVTAILTYRTNKKSKKELNTELRMRLREQDHATANEIKKMQNQLDKQLDIYERQKSWDTSTPATREYLAKVGVKRCGNVSNLSSLVSQIYLEIQNNNLSVEDLKLLKKMLLKIELPNANGELYPYEIPYLISYNKLLRDVDKLLENSDN